MNVYRRSADPFRAMLDLQRALASASPPSREGVERTGGRSFPPVNIFRQGDDYVAVAELPGVDKDCLEIQILDNRIRLAGKREIAYEEGHSVHRRERLGGRFDRTFDLPVGIDAEQAKAEFRNGLLAIHLPRAESDKPRSVPIS